MGKTKSFISLYEYALGSLFFIHVLAPKLIVLGILFFVLALTVEGLEKKLKIIADKRIHFVFALFYLAYGIGCFFTDIPHEAKHVMESKLSFLIFPILFLFVPERKINFSIPVWMFVIGLLLEFALAIGSNFPQLIATGDLSNLITRNSHHHHPTYMSIFDLMGMFLLYYGWKRNWKGFKQKLVLGIGAVLFLDYFLCLSLAALLFLMLLIIFLGFKWFTKRYSWKKTLLILGVAIIGLGTVLEVTDETISEIGETISSIGEFSSSPEKFVNQPNKRFTSNEIRLVVWSIAVDAIQKQPMGYGTGNIDKVMGAGYQNYQLNYFIENAFNPHNQYLQTWIEIGIVGFLVLLGLFFTIFHYARKKKNYLLLLLVVCFAFNSLFESMFQAQSGIVFFAIATFFLTLLSIQQGDFPSEENSIETI